MAEWLQAFEKKRVEGAEGRSGIDAEAGERDWGVAFRGSV
jgi:hypothetical protein